MENLSLNFQWRRYSSFFLKLSWIWVSGYDQVTIEHLEFSPLERRIYDSMYTDAKKHFEQLRAKGLVGKNYTHILAMLMRYKRIFKSLVFYIIIKRTFMIGSAVQSSIRV